MSTDGTEDAAGGGPAEEPLEMAPAEVGYVLARLADDYTRAVRELLGMTLWLPLKGEQGQFIVTHRGDRKLIRAYTSPARVKAVAGPDVNPDDAVLRPFAELLRQWASDEIGLVINPESETELQLPPHLFPKILELRQRMIADDRAAAERRRAEPGPAPAQPLVPIEPPSEIGTFRFASLVDAVGPDGGPVVSPDRPRITDPEEKRKVREYLTGGEVLLMMAGRVGDLFAPNKGEIVPANTLTDGTWVWSDGMAYYLDNYDLGPEPEFYRAIVDRGYHVPRVSKARVRHASRALEERHRIAGELYQQWLREQGRSG